MNKQRVLIDGELVVLNVYRTFQRRDGTHTAKVQHKGKVRNVYLNEGLWTAREEKKV